jgi:hypothetical protein|tara:strand:+ start:3261 stop:3467 length:207 start_codon:yes stop_codon:yes gene_type:complete
MNEEIYILKLKHIRDLARAMRGAQRTYLKTRKQADLIEAKKLEAALDLLLRAGYLLQDKVNFGPLATI